MASTFQPLRRAMSSSASVTVADVIASRTGKQEREALRGAGYCNTTPKIWQILNTTIIIVCSRTQKRRHVFNLPNTES